MSEIDCSEAKPGYDIHINWGDHSYFYQIIGDRYVRENGFYAVISEVKEIERAVVTVRPSAWSGDGLPPVGTVCEASAYGVRNWFECKVVIHHPKEPGVAGVHDLVGDALLWVDTLRPIRTPEQIAAEERNKAIRAIELHILRAQERYLSVVQTAQRIYDAGFQVPKQ